MIWLAWRRNRLLLLVMLGVFIALAVWMILVAHASDAITEHSCLQVSDTNAFRCTGPLYVVNRSSTSASDQAAVINVLLLFLPCLLGIVFGAPLVANEAEHATNRLAWTQGRSRTAWLATSWVVVAALLLAATVAFSPIAQWWSGRVYPNIPESLFLPGSRIQPNFFGITGAVLVAYTLFAFALGVAMGAVLRRTSVAVVATIVVYGVVAVIMVVVVRPSLAPTAFLKSDTTDSVQYVTVPYPPPWVVTYEYRYIPGVKQRTTTVSPDQIGTYCQGLGESPSLQARCLTKSGVEGGFVYLAPNRYWQIQWREALIYLGATIILFSFSVWTVRRWST
jgi:hypothetical protein